LFLTSAGKKLTESLRRATKPVDRRLASALTERERDELKSLLRTVVESLT
jgi:DNA-binding MarR family transcriptional regulator